MRFPVKSVAGLVVVIAGLGAAAQALARRKTVGDETADEFEIATYVGGVQRTCRAPSLRRGGVSVFCGGVDLDLREAALDPAGATLALSATWGGVNVTVPETWRVLVEQRAVLGGVDARVTPPEELPVDAPTLRVEVTARLGGVALRADRSSGAPEGANHRLEGWASS
ncbi:MAG: hypothetical protein M5U27_15060 [Gaiella sp.]|nr:hypothetical protein [Gaiella sp.]